MAPRRGRFNDPIDDVGCPEALPPLIPPRSTPQRSTTTHSATQPSTAAPSEPEAFIPWFRDLTRHPQPYTDPLTPRPGSEAYPEESLAEWAHRFERMALCARGQLPGQPNHTGAKKAPASRKGQTPHKRLTKAIAKALKDTFGKDRISVKVRNVMLTTLDRGKETERTFVTGVAGEADLEWQMGKLVGYLEAKVGKDVQRDSQKKFEKRCRERGTPYQVIHATDDSRKEIGAAAARAVAEVRRACGLLDI